MRWFVLGLGIGCAGDPKQTEDTATSTGDDDDTTGDDDDTTGDDDDTTGDDDDTTGNDADGDGYAADIDCDDADDAVYPGAPDVCGDDRVTDCDRTSDDGLITVDGAASFLDLQAALDAASAGATVTVCPGTYPGTFTAPEPIALVAHGGPDVTILDGAQAGTTLTVQGGSEVVGFTVTGGLQPTRLRAGGIDLVSTGTLLVDDCVITDNGSSSGAGLYLPEGATLTLRDSLVAGNDAVENGDGIYDAGCGVYAEGDTALDLTGSTITDNTTCGVFVRSGTAVGGTLTENRGMGLWISLPGNDSFALTGMEVTANDGVGIAATASSGFPDTMTFEDVTMSANRGGGLRVSGTVLTLLGATEIVDNTATSGAGVVLQSAASLTGGLVARNVATVLGGGMYVQFGGYDDAIVQDVVIEDNVAPDGAGIAFGDDSGEVTFVGGRIVGNVATGRGGAFDLPDEGYYVPRIVFEGVEISDNTAAQGGGLALAGGIVTLDQCMVGRNSATEGGGVYLSDGADLASFDSDFGLDADANVPGDVYAGSELAGIGPNASFTCTATGCTPAP